MASLSLVHLTKRFGDTVAVREVSLEIADGEFMVLVGPSGCGKSTILRVVAGLEEPSEGEIRLGGVVVNDLEPKDRDLAMVFQNYALYPHMTVQDNIAFGLRLRRTPPEQIVPRVREAAEMLGVEMLLERRPGELSGGQRQRVALARAIVREPAAFLMDEPLSNLDAQLRVQTRAELIKLHRRLGITTLYVTHDQVEAMTMGDRIAVMQGGRLLQVDTPLGLYNLPANQFVAGFIGSPAMNFVEGEVLPSNGDLVVDMGEYRLGVSAEKREALREYLGAPVTVGVRPSDLLDARREIVAGGALNTFSATVEVVEQLGAETLLHLRAGQDRLIMKTEGASDAAPEESLRVAADLGRLHFFDRHTEQRIA